MTSHHDSPSPSELVKLVTKHRLLNSINPSRLQALTEQLSWVQLDAGEFEIAGDRLAYLGLIHAEPGGAKSIHFAGGLRRRERRRDHADE